MKTALIGYTGFVGGNIVAQNKFDDLYNTSNINDIDGKEYDLLVSAATYAEMWRINQDPKGDLERIDSLIERLKHVKTKKFVLISTVGIYKNPNGADEATPIDTEGLSPYGMNRYHLEEFIRNNSPSLIIRLPGLFGIGLKKNVIYDLLNNNMVEKINSKGTYQYYNLANIWQDIQVALKNSLDLVNFATEPVTSEEVATECFKMKTFKQEPPDVKPAYWDMHTKNAAYYGSKSPYLYSKDQVLTDIRTFVNNYRAQQ